MASVSNSQLANRIETLVHAWNRREAQYAAWAAGSADGGKDADGIFDLTDSSGQVFRVPSPARVADMVSGPAAEAVQAARASESIKDRLASEIARMDALRASLDGTLSAALAYKNQSEHHALQSANHEANVRHYHDNVAEDAEHTSLWRDDAQYYAGWAENWSIYAHDYAVDAKAAADRAGNYDPLQYATKSNGLSEIVGLAAALNERSKQSDFLALQKTVGTKADQTALTTLTATVNTKADKTALTALTSTVNEKADKTALSSLSTSHASLQADLARKPELVGGNVLTGVQKFKSVGEPAIQILQEDEMFGLRFGPKGGVSFKENGVWQTPMGNLKDLAFRSELTSYALKTDLSAYASVATVQGLDGQVQNRAILTGPNVFRRSQKIEAAHTEPILYLESGGNVTDNDHVNGAELVVSSYQPRIMFHDRSASAKHLLMHYNGAGSGGWFYIRNDKTGDGLYSDAALALNTATYELKLGGSNVLTDVTGTTQSATNLGRTGNVALVGGTRAPSWWGTLANGYSVMTNLTTANGSPVNGYGYFMKVAKRDADLGWAGVFITHSSAPELWFGRSENGSQNYADWSRAWTNRNFDPASKLNAEADKWIRSGDGVDRLYFRSSDKVTFLRGEGIEMRNNSSNAPIGRFNADGSFKAGTEIYTGDNGWFRVTGRERGIYWEQHGGGWYMTDNTWMRLYGDKALHTRGAYYGVDYIRTDTHFKVGEVIQPVFRSGTAAPANSLGVDGDIYIQY